jgi:hypothetical protein
MPRLYEARVKRKRSNAKAFQQVAEDRAVRTFYILLFTFYFLAGCAWFQRAPEAPLRQATAEQLTGMLQERETTIRTMKGLFRAQIKGPGVLVAQRVEGAMYYRRPEALRLQGFNQFGGKLFEFSRNRDLYRLDLPSEGKRFAGSVEELRRAKIGRLMQLSQWAVNGVVGTDSSSGAHVALVEDDDRYRLDVFDAAPGGRVLRRLWFERRSLQMVQEERLLLNGEVEALMTFDDFRPIPVAPASDASERAALMPFKITVVDQVASGSVVLMFHEIVLNPSLKPEELGVAARPGGLHESAGG